jgi:predicted CoA-substrate-specific enzyme activase
VSGLNSISDIACLVGTGYGRSEISFARENVSEISCHALGAFFCDPSIKTIVDIGGQDVKGIAVNEDGSVLEFAMNDKCAAGTGRFFEAMSRIFRLELDEFSEISLKAKRPIAVTAQCSVFAETEVISLLAQKNPPSDIAAGIQSAVARRCFTLLKRVGVRPQITVTGGCAKNKGLLKALEEILKLKITPLSIDPQLMGALGAAVYARRMDV